MPLHLRAVALVLVGIVSVQFGAVFAKQAFEHATPLTVVCLRQLVGAIILMAWARPRLRGRSRRAWISVLGYAAALGVMNWAFYESFARIPLGIAVTIEFLGPLGLALVVSRRRIDFLWVALAATGIGVLGLE